MLSTYLQHSLQPLCICFVPPKWLNLEPSSSFSSVLLLFCCCWCNKFHAAAAAGILYTDSKYLTPAHNSQPWHFKLYRKKKIKIKIKPSPKQQSQMLGQQCTPIPRRGSSEQTHGSHHTELLWQDTGSAGRHLTPHTTTALPQALAKHTGDTKKNGCTVQFFKLDPMQRGTIVHVKTSATFKS